MSLIGRKRFKWRFATSIERSGPRVSGETYAVQWPFDEPPASRVDAPVHAYAGNGLSFALQSINRVTRCVCVCVPAEAAKVHRDGRSACLRGWWVSLAPETYPQRKR